MVYFCKSAGCLSNCQGQKCDSYCILYFIFKWPVPAYIFAYLSNIAYIPASRIKTHRHLVEAENEISNCENWWATCLRCIQQEIHNNDMYY